MEHIVKGRTVLIDDEDEKIFQSYNWHISDSGYCVWRGIKDGRKQTIRLHRLIAKPRNGLVVDHINRNKLDNRRKNLRCVTAAVNLKNTERVENAKGYYYSNSKCRINNKWVVDYAGVDNTFATEEEAKRAVEEIKKGTFVKEKVKKHNICARCGASKGIYGGIWTCRACALRRSKEYYQRKRRNNYVKTKKGD